MLAWNNAVTARANITVQDAQLKVAKLAAQGMSEEFRYGQRSTLDLLVAEQNLREAQIALINSQHDAFVADAALLRHMGYLEARSLIVGLEAYDPSAYLRKVKEKGDVPWEGLVKATDAIGQRKTKQGTIEQPQDRKTRKMSEAVVRAPEIKVAGESRTLPLVGPIEGGN